MTKRKPATRSKPKTKSKSRKASSRKPSRKAKVIPVVVQKVNLPPAGILRVVPPPGAVPIALHDPVRGVVDIVALPKKKKAWWDFS